MARFHLSTLILATSLFAIAWGCAVLPWVTVKEAVSFIQPGKLIVIHETKRPPNASEIAIRTTAGTAGLFLAWAGIRLLVRRG